jgi:hypothetical protein
MASKSKRAKMAPQDNLQRKFMYWAIAVLLVKFAIIFRIQGLNAGSGDRVYFVDGAWVGADGENYLMGYFALIRDGVFSTESILNYWPAGYPLFIFLLSFLGKSWVLTTLSIVQSLAFSYAVYLFASQLSRTRLKKYSYLAFVMIILNPTLSLSSIVIGYESITASGLLISCALIIKDFIGKNDKKFIKYLVLNSLILGFLAFVQPRLIISGALILLLWIYLRKGIKVGIKSLIISFLILAIFPASLIIRNNQALGLTSISTNLGVTMNLGAGDGATGGYVGSTSKAGVPCEITGNSVEQDNQRVKCVLNWYLKNPGKSIELFYNKSIYFWSPWDGPIANGTMARNPWLTVSPIRDAAMSSEDGNKLVYGTAGKIASWVWLLSGLCLLLYGFLILWRQGSIEKMLAAVALVTVGTNWAVSLMTIGDHRFRIPIMGFSILLQSIGIRNTLSGKKFRI